MQPFFKMAVLLLLAAVVAAPLAVQGIRSDGASHMQPAGCHLSTNHGDGGNMPAPGPTSHNCCQAGHHPAILQTNSTLRRSLRGPALVECFEQPAVVVVLGELPNFFVISGDPPVLSPLRV